MTTPPTRSAFTSAPIIGITPNTASPSFSTLMALQWITTGPRTRWTRLILPSLRRLRGWCLKQDGASPAWITGWPTRISFLTSGLRDFGLGSGDWLFLLHVSVDYNVEPFKKRNGSRVLAFSSPAGRLRRKRAQ